TQSGDNQIASSEQQAGVMPVESYSLFLGENYNMQVLNIDDKAADLTQLIDSQIQLYFKNNGIGSNQVEQFINIESVDLDDEVFNLLYKYIGDWQTSSSQRPEMVPCDEF